MTVDSDGARVAEAVAARQAEICQELGQAGRLGLARPSLLPGWNRLTIACHLRYGAAASARMTEDTLAGKPTAFYPLGRNVQRDLTLTPEAAESPNAVVASLEFESRRLDQLWCDLERRHWSMAVIEPADNPDLGSITLATLAMLRLTEVEVHGFDLDLDLSPWSDTFVTAALAMRLGWLPTRRSNHRATDRTVDGSWALLSSDGPSYLVQADGAMVAVVESPDNPSADATIAGTCHQLLAFILGRQPLDQLRVEGDTGFAARFLIAFPAP